MVFPKLASKTGAKIAGKIASTVHFSSAVKSFSRLADDSTMLSHRFVVPRSHPLALLKQIHYSGLNALHSPAFHAVDCLHPTMNSSISVDAIQCGEVSEEDHYMNMLMLTITVVKKGPKYGLEFLEECIERGVVISIEMVSMIIEAFMARGDFNDCRLTLHYMEKNFGLKPTTNLCNSIVDGFFKNADCEGGKLMVFDMIDVYGVLPDDDTYRILVNAAAESTEGMAVFRQFLEKKARSKKLLFNSNMHFLADGSVLEKILEPDKTPEH